MLKAIDEPVVDLMTDHLQSGTRKQAEYLLNKWGIECALPTYKTNIIALVESFEKIPFRDLPSLEERKQVVELITEAHYKQTGVFPKPFVLSLLGDYLLSHYIKDVTKSKFDENTFHTKHQTKRRQSREYSTVSDKMDYFNTKKHLNVPSLHKKAVKQVEQ